MAKDNFTEKARKAVLSALPEDGSPIPRLKLLDHVAKVLKPRRKREESNTDLSKALAKLQKADEIVRHTEEGPAAYRRVPKSDKVDADDKSAVSDAEGKKLERRLYQPVARCLVERGECSEAIPYGNPRGRGKWGNPDVIGIIHPTGASGNFSHEIVAVEIKRDTLSLFEGFGQACAYREFAHRPILVVPDPGEIKAKRLVALCNLYGIGLYFFVDHGFVQESGSAKSEDLDLLLRVPVRSRPPDPREASEFLHNMEDAKRKELGLGRN